MQKTETYQFNLIEGSDPFSQEPINENTLALEAVLSQLPKIQTGSYVGTGVWGVHDANTLTFDFVPKLVLIMGNCYLALFLAGMDEGIAIQAAQDAYHVRMNASWEGSTLSWYPRYAVNSAAISNGSSASQLNSAGETYHFIVFS